MDELINDLRIANYAWYLEYWDVADAIETALYERRYEDKVNCLQTALALMPSDPPKGKEQEHLSLADQIANVIYWLNNRVRNCRHADFEDTMDGAICRDCGLEAVSKDE